MTDASLIWDKAKEQLKSKLDTSEFEAWILPLKFTAEKEGLITLQAPDVFFKDWIKKNYSGAI